MWARYDDTPVEDLKGNLLLLLLWNFIRFLFIVRSYIYLSMMWTKNFIHVWWKSGIMKILQNFSFKIDIAHMYADRQSNPVDIWRKFIE